LKQLSVRNSSDFEVIQITESDLELDSPNVVHTRLFGWLRREGLFEIICHRSQLSFPRIATFLNFEVMIGCSIFSKHLISLM